MKTGQFRLGALVLIVVCLIGLTACGGGGNAAFDGKWESAYVDMAGMKAISPGITLDIKGTSGTYAIASDGNQNSAPVKVEYKDGKAIITFANVEGADFPAMEASIEDGNLVIGNYLGGEADTKLILTKDLKNFKFPEDVNK